MAGHGRGWPVSVRRVLDLAPAVPLTVFHNLCNWRHCQKGHTGERARRKECQNITERDAAVLIDWSLAERRRHSLSRRKSKGKILLILILP